MDYYDDLTREFSICQLKSRAPARGERVPKYNRLTEIAGAAPRPPCPWSGRVNPSQAVILYVVKDYKSPDPAASPGTSVPPRRCWD